MDFKILFLEALQSGMDDEALLKMAHKSETKSLHLKDIYDLMQRIWVDFGFNDRTDGGELQDRLEYVMEKIWYECPATEGMLRSTIVEATPQRALTK